MGKIQQKAKTNYTKIRKLRKETWKKMADVNLAITNNG